MKKITLLLTVIITLLMCSVMAFASDTDAVTLISENTKKFYVVIPAKATDNEKYAADILCEKLEMIYDVDAQIASDSEKVSGKIISVGDTVYNNADLSDKKSGSYVVTSIDNGIGIYGNGNRGLIDGIYRFLSDYCNYEVYTKDVIGFTDEKSLSVPYSVNIEYSPYFEYRRVDTASVYDEEYSRANSVNSVISVPNYQGGIIEYISLFGHTLSTQFCSADKYFASNLEYFALHNGERTKDQLCLTNPDTLKIVTEEVFDLLEEKYDENSDLQIISLTQNDNYNYCECEKCKALDEQNGSHAGSVITFVNAIADAVKNAGYDNVLIDTFAYQYSRTCPTNVIPKDNVIVRLCSIECCFGHTLDDENCSENIKFMQDLKNWSSICNKLYIWDYVNNYSETLLPFANFQVLQRNMQIFYENGVKGVYEEGNYYMYKCNGEFYELRSYLLSKLMQNPYRDDYDELMNDYLANIYGEGGKYIREFIDLITKRSVTDKKHLTIRQQPSECLPGITLSEISAANKMWENAKSSAVTSKQLAEIERSELCWQYWKCCKCVSEYSPLHGIYNYMTARKNLYNKILSMGNTALGEYENKYITGGSFRIYFLAPNIWEKKYDNVLWSILDPIAEKIYSYFESTNV